MDFEISLKINNDWFWWIMYWLLFLCKLILILFFSCWKVYAFHYLYKYFRKVRKILAIISYLLSSVQKVMKCKLYLYILFPCVCILYVLHVYVYCMYCKFPFVYILFQKNRTISIICIQCAHREVHRKSLSSHRWS